VNITNHNTNCLLKLIQILNKLPRQDHVKILHTAKTDEMIEKLIKQGSHSIQVIVDFDATVTKYHVNGKKCDSSYGK